MSKEKSLQRITMIFSGLEQRNIYISFDSNYGQNNNIRTVHLAPAPPLWKTAIEQGFRQQDPVYWNRYPFSGTQEPHRSSVKNSEPAGSEEPDCATLPQGDGCFVAVKAPVKPRTAILPLITVSEVKAPSNARTAGPAFQLHDTFPPATVAGV